MSVDNKVGGIILQMSFLHPHYAIEKINFRFIAVDMDCKGPIEILLNDYLTAHQNLLKIVLVTKNNTWKIKNHLSGALIHN